MNKQFVIIGVLVILISVELSGCTNIPIDTTRNKFVGTWVTNKEHVYYEFFSDGTGSIQGGSTTWEIKNGKVIIYTSDQSLTYTYSYSFSNNDKSLTLSDLYKTNYLTKQ